MTGLYDAMLAGSGLLDLLAPFDPHVAGTLPLGLAMPSSDIDLLCYAPDPNKVGDVLWASMREQPRFALRRWIDQRRLLVATFILGDWPIEVFAAPDPIQHQAGWRHFRVEQRLLALGGSDLRARVMRERRRGMKTEPAFASVLRLTGDSYEALLSLEGVTNEALIDLIDRPDHMTMTVVPGFTRL